MTQQASPAAGAERPFFDVTPVGAVWHPSEEGDATGGALADDELKCNAYAWGLACERRDICAHRVPRADFAAACRHGLPTLEEARRGYSLFACTPGKFEHFDPVPGADLV